MSTNKKGHTDSPKVTTMTLADVRDRILDDAVLGPDRRKKLASAVERMAEILGQPVETIPAHPPLLRDLMANVIPLAVGMTEGGWRNLRADFQAALAHLGIVRIARRAAHALSPAWKALINPLPDYGARYKLSRFASHCTSEDIQPEAVDDAVMEQFLQTVISRSLIAGAQRSHRDAVIAWNRAAAAVPGWPQRRLTVPDNTNRYAIPWERFPASLKADADAWLEWLGGDDPKGERPFRALRPKSIVLRRKQVHTFVSALVLSGIDPAELTSLAEVVVPDRVAVGLEFFFKRAGNKPSLHACQVASTLCSIAKHHAKASDDDRRRLKNMRLKATPEGAGMTEKNRLRLTPLMERKVQMALIGLPYDVAAEVIAAGEFTRNLALQMETAVSLALVFATALRFGNVADLRLDEHLPRSPVGGMRVVLPRGAVKNREERDIPLPERTVALIDRYLRDWRPLLGEAASPWLFPGQTAGAPKTTHSLRTRFQKCIRARLGLHFHPHLARHLTALMTLQKQPGAYALVQRLLGHRSINTTVSAYSGLETQSQIEFFHKDVLGFGDEEAPPQTPARSGRRKPRKRNSPKRRA